MVSALPLRRRVSTAILVHVTGSEELRSGLPTAYALLKRRVGRPDLRGGPDEPLKELTRRFGVPFSPFRSLRHLRNQCAHEGARSGEPVTSTWADWANLPSQGRAVRIAALAATARGLSRARLFELDEDRRVRHLTYRRGGGCESERKRFPGAVLGPIAAVSPGDTHVKVCAFGVGALAGRFRSSNDQWSSIWQRL